MIPVLDSSHGQDLHPHSCFDCKCQTGTYDHHDHETMKTISTVQLLDAPGDATRGEVWH